MQPPDTYPKTEIDERFLVEWFDFGWAELAAYLAKYAHFHRWCVEHYREESA